MSYISPIFEFIQKYWLPINLFAIVLFFASILISLSIVLRLPQDYWLHENYRKPGIVESFFRNILALLLFFMGFLMLFLPGQGIITIVISLLIADIPYKRALVRYFIHKKKVQEGFDWLRVKFSKPPFLWPKED